MMQNLTKSVFRFGWAMGMLGVDQAANLLDRERGWRRSTDSLDAVSDRASDLLGDTAKRVFVAGDHLQSGLIDTAMSLARGATENPSAAIRDARRGLEETWTTVRSDLRSTAESEPATDSHQSWATDRDRATEGDAEPRHED